MSDPIISFSENAITHISKTIATRGSGMGFRLAVKQTGCSGYMYVPEIIDVPRDGDIEVPSNDQFKVYVDPAAVTILQGTYVDFITKPMGMQQLEYDNPNADSLCGCGESFNLKDQNEG